MSDRDIMKIQILADGTIKTVTDPISADNHDAAENFLTTVARLGGGETTREARTDVKREHHHHHHDEGHTHSHN